MSEPTEMVESVVDKTVDLICGEEDARKKLKNFLSVMAIIFVVIPIIFHFLALQEKQIYANIVSELSSVNITTLSPDLIDNYESLVKACDEDALLFNKVYSRVKAAINNFSNDKGLLYQIDFDGLIKFVGFSYKADVFRPILLWNLIPLSVLSIVFVIILGILSKDDYSGFKKILYPMLWCLGLLATVGIYSLVLGYILAWICPLILFSVDATVVIYVVLSIVVTFLLVRWIVIYFE